MKTQAPVPGPQKVQWTIQPAIWKTKIYAHALSLHLLGTCEISWIPGGPNTNPNGFRSHKGKAIILLLTYPLHKNCPHGASTPQRIWTKAINNDTRNLNLQMKLAALLNHGHYTMVGFQWHTWGPGVHCLCWAGFLLHMWGNVCGCTHLYTNGAKGAMQCITQHEHCRALAH